MSKSPDAIKILLIQARNTEGMEIQERQCFSERCDLPLHQFTYANVVRDSIHDDLLDGVDAMMIGGAGEYSATQDYPWMDDLLQLVCTATAGSVPTFGACWGHQIIARALGGSVIHDLSHAEMGCGEVQLTPDGKADRLFQGYPTRFKANMGHHDRVDILPPDAIELAFNESQRNEAFRIKDKPVYGTQFHSELDAARERERLLAYRDFYREILESEAAFQAVLADLADTTEADQLLRDFLNCYVIQDT